MEVPGSGVAGIRLFEMGPLADPALMKNSERILNKVQTLARMYSSSAETMKLPLHQKQNARRTRAPPDTQTGGLKEQGKHVRSQRSSQNHTDTNRPNTVQTHTQTTHTRAQNPNKTRSLVQTKAGPPAPWLEDGGMKEEQETEDKWMRRRGGETSGRFTVFSLLRNYGKKLREFYINNSLSHGLSHGL